MGSPLLFDGWSGLARILIIAPFAYAALVLFLRISGKRTLTKLNAFDLVITVALGSTLATQILSKQTPLIEGVLAFALLVALQWLVTSFSVRWGWFARLVRSQPTILYEDGAPQREAMRRERITESELLQAVRTCGGMRLSDARYIILQTDGSLAAILRGAAP